MEPMDTGPAGHGTFQATPASTDASGRIGQVPSPLAGPLSGRRDDQPTQAPTTLAARHITALNSSATRIPAPEELMSLLTDLPGCTALELGEALGLPSLFLLQIASLPSKPRLLKTLLQTACPLTIARLVEILDSDYLQRPDLARQVLATAKEQNLVILEANMHQALESISSHLAAFTGTVPALATAFGLGPDTTAAIQKRARTGHDRLLLKHVTDAACRHQSLTCADWLAALARTGMTEEQLAHWARHWQLPLPTVDSSLPAGPDAVPSPAEVAQAILQCPGTAPFGEEQFLELGIMLDIPVHWLLSLLPKGHPLNILHDLLEWAYPLDIQQLARALESPQLQAFDIAARVRDWASENGLDTLTADMPELGQLALLLAPEARRAPQLALLLGVRPEQIQNCLTGLFSPLQSQDALRMLIHRADREYKRSCEQWLAVLGEATGDEALLQHLAGRWQLMLPTDHTCWQDWCRSRSGNTHQLSRYLMERQKHFAGTPVPLSQAWQLTREYSDKPAFGLVLEHPLDRSLCMATTGDSRLAALTWLVRHAARQASGGLSWEKLEQLAHFQCVQPELVRRLPPAQQEPMTVSRQLLPADVLQLVAGVAAPEREALEVAALLGVGEDFAAMASDYPHDAPQDQAVRIWRRIGNRLPELETGHLVQLFQAFDKKDLVARLTGDANSCLPPTVALDELPGRAATFVELARQLKPLPEQTINTFAACCHLDKGLCTTVPKGMNPLCCLLNGLARADDEHIEALRALLALEQSPEKTPEDAMETGDHASKSVDTGAQQPTDWSQEDYQCPIMLDYMEDPVAIHMSTRDGRSRIRYFGHDSLIKSVRRKACNPLSREPLSLADVQALKVDIAHRACIEYWRSQHPELEEASAAPELEEENRHPEPEEARPRGELQESRKVFQPELKVSTPPPAPWRLPAARWKNPDLPQRQMAQIPPEPNASPLEKVLCAVAHFPTSYRLKPDPFLRPQQQLNNNEVPDGVAAIKKAHRESIERGQESFACPALSVTLHNMHKLTKSIINREHFYNDLTAKELAAFRALEEMIEQLISMGAPYRSTVQLAVLMSTMLEITTIRDLFEHLRTTQPDIWRQHRLKTFDFRCRSDQTPTGTRLNTADIGLDQVRSCRWGGLNDEGTQDENACLFAGEPGLWDFVCRHLDDPDVIFYPTFEPLSPDAVDALIRQSVYPLTLTTDFAVMYTNDVFRTPLAVMQQDIREAQVIRDLDSDVQKME